MLPLTLRQCVFISENATPLQLRSPSWELMGSSAFIQLAFVSNLGCSGRHGIYLSL